MNVSNGSDRPADHMHQCLRSEAVSDLLNIFTIVNNATKWI